MISNESFKKAVLETANRKNSFGNQILYDMCSKAGTDGWEAAQVLGDKIWLIGRSYAASPERRYKWDKNEQLSEKDKKLTTVGDGTETYFHWIAGELKFPLENFENTEYKFDFSTDDLNILTESVKAVINFNETVRAANRAYDVQYNTEQAKYMNHRNQISFCSKFLHFHYPDRIFIIDEFSERGGKHLFSKGMRTDAQLGGFSLEAKNTWKKLRANIDEGLTCKEKREQFETVFIEEQKNTSGAGLIKDYTTHCLHAYLTGCLIQICANGQFIECSMPRAVDNLFLHIKARAKGTF